MMAVSGTPSEPESIAPMPTSAQRAWVAGGVGEVGDEFAAGSADHEQRGEHAAGGSGAEGEGPHERLGEEEAEEQAEWGVAAEEFGDVVVADAEAAREEEAADADADAADGGPPHPVDLEVAEEVFEAVHDAAEHELRRGRRAGRCARAMSGDWWRSRFRRAQAW